ncbi:hypothetical protein OGATHE_003782 [Ogataea polymorpha]|uniref:Uncharacterized protein n=1 Tax=Ogataea polymorpha TaxID=460523 RepID=A0A9P8P4B4_9ASCO|nr:hypothetical protein OGATHE_003782 [Ogataea polymorpha]
MMALCTLIADRIATGYVSHSSVEFLISVNTIASSPVGGSISSSSLRRSESSGNDPRSCGNKASRFSDAGVLFGRVRLVLDGKNGVFAIRLGQNAHDIADVGHVQLVATNVNNRGATPCEAVLLHCKFVGGGGAVGGCRAERGRLVLVDENAHFGVHREKRRAQRVLDRLARVLALKLLGQMDLKRFLDDLGDFVAALVAAVLAVIDRDQLLVRVSPEPLDHHVSRSETRLVAECIRDAVAVFSKLRHGRPHTHVNTLVRYKVRSDGDIHQSQQLKVFQHKERVQTVLHALALVQRLDLEPFVAREVEVLEFRVVAPVPVVRYVADVVLEVVGSNVERCHVGDFRQLCRQRMESVPVQMQRVHLGEGLEVVDGQAGQMVTAQI